VSLAALVAHMEARYSKCAIRASDAQMEQELSEVTYGLAAIPKAYVESEQDEIEFGVSSQPEHDSAGSSIAEAVSSIGESNAADAGAAASQIEADSTLKETGSSHAAPLVGSVAESLGGLAISHPEEDKEEEL
jgi:hypothetical protein